MEETRKKQKLQISWDFMKCRNCMKYSQKRGILDETHSYLSGGMKQLLYIVLNVVY